MRAQTTETPRPAPAVAWQIAAVLVAASGLSLMVGLAPPLLAVGGILALFLAFLFLLRPHLGLLLLLFLRASSDAIPTPFDGAGLLARLLNANAAIILVLVVAGGAYILVHRLPVISIPGGRVYILLLLTGLLGAAHTKSVLFSVNEWLPLVSMLVVYVLAAGLLSGEERIRRTVDVVGASFIVPAAVALYQISTGIANYGSGFRRIQSTFAHPNPFAFYLVFILALFLGQAVTSSGWRKWISVCIVAASGALLVQTYTRSAWIGALAVVLVFGALQSRALLLLAPLSIWLILRGVPSIGARLEDPMGGSFASRLEIWGVLLERWSNVTSQGRTPVTTAIDRLIGLGPGGFGSLLFSDRIVWPHNDYLRVLVEYGMFGLILFLLLYAVLIIMAYRTWRRSSGPVKPIALSLIAVSLAYLIVSFTDNLFAMTVNQVYFFAIAGLVAAAYMNAERKAAASGRQQDERRATGVRIPASAPGLQ